MTRLTGYALYASMGQRLPRMPAQLKNLSSLMYLSLNDIPMGLDVSPD